jgi:hypothetical protein
VTEGFHSFASLLQENAERHGVSHNILGGENMGIIYNILKLCRVEKRNSSKQISAQIKQ